MKPVWILGLLLLGAHSSNAQRIVKIVEDYVLIDSIESTWRVGDEVRIKRRVQEDGIEVGTARLLRFRERKAAGKIVRTIQPFHVRIGDTVESRQRRKPDAGDSNVFHQNQTYPIVRIVSDYVLLDADSEIGGIDEIVQVRRITGRGFVDVGTIRILRFREGKTAAKIIRETEPFRIRIGDLVFVEAPDIDYYFLDSFEPE